MTRQLALALLVAVGFAPVSAHASPFDGDWHVSFPCLTASAECQGRSDEFTLQFWSSGDRLCGNHLATAHLGNRVDEGDLLGAPSIVGTMESGQALVAFRSAWGGSGHARLTLADGRLRWHLVDRDNGTMWLPDDADLERSKMTGPARLTCTTRAIHTP